MYKHANDEVSLKVSWKSILKILSLSCIFKIRFKSIFILYLQDTFFQYLHLVSSRYFLKVSCTTLWKAHSKTLLIELITALHWMQGGLVRTKVSVRLSVLSVCQSRGLWVVTKRMKNQSRFLANVNSCSGSLYVVVRPSVCLSSVCLSPVCRLSSVTFVHPTQPIEIFGNVSAPCNTLGIWQHPGKILQRSSQGNPYVGG